MPYSLLDFTVLALFLHFITQSSVKKYVRIQLIILIFNMPKRKIISYNKLYKKVKSTMSNLASSSESDSDFTSDVESVTTKIITSSFSNLLSESDSSECNSFSSVVYSDTNDSSSESVYNSSSESELYSDSSNDDELHPEVYPEHCSNIRTEGNNFTSELAKVVYKMSLKSGDKLLKLLKDNGHPELPLTSRTLLNNSINILIEYKSGCEYYFFGVAKMIYSYLNKFKTNLSSLENTLELMMNIDGLPLYKSSNICVWPILIKIVNLNIIFPVAITLGKPKNLDFMLDTINELTVMLSNGLSYNDTIINLNLTAIVADAPAKSFIKQII